MIDFGLGVRLDALDNLEIYRAWRNDPSIWRWTRQNDLITTADQVAWFERQGHDPAVKMYSIWSPSGDSPPKTAGVCGLTSINLTNRNAEFSLYIAPEAQGGGLGSAALITLFYHGFKNMGLKQIWGETFENNPAQKIFTDIGMKQDGKRRKFYWKDGKLWDALLFSIFSDEFLTLHGDRSCFGPL